MPEYASAAAAHVLASTLSGHLRDVEVCAPPQHGLRVLPANLAVLHSEHIQRKVDYLRRQQHSKKLDRDGDSEPETYMTKVTSTRASKGEGGHNQHDGTVGTYGTEH
ncbi:hypothetical protein OH77DRAFT_1419922 [Trametes cingulata]|nr:hypothetical protein OH77DRAFT_1419922 [Trametes cingulata]